MLSGLWFLCKRCTVPITCLEPLHTIQYPSTKEDEGWEVGVDSDIAIKIGLRQNHN